MPATGDKKSAKRSKRSKAGAKRSQKSVGSLGDQDGLPEGSPAGGAFETTSAPGAQGPGEVGAERRDRGHPDVLHGDQVSSAVLAFSLLAEPSRVRILWALRDGETDVAGLATIAGCRPTVASQHLSKLRLGGLVDSRRDGRRVLYRLRGAHVRSLLTEALFHADHQVSGAAVHES